jgi:hypothetical protein
MSDVRPRDGGPYGLYCYSCNRWIPNTANGEMRKEGVCSHGHVCYEKDGKRIVLLVEGIKDEEAKP